MQSITKQKNSCAKKKQYSSKEAAQCRARSLWNKGIKLKPYKCDICDGWHVCKVSWRTSLDCAFKDAGLGGYLT